VKLTERSIVVGVVLLLLFLLLLLLLLYSDSDCVVSDNVDISAEKKTKRCTFAELELTLRRQLINWLYIKPLLIVAQPRL